MADVNNEKVSVMMPGNIIAQIDAQVGGGYMDREDFIRAAVRNYLKEIREVNDSRGSAIG
jgi:metal-responsive CopG/Arc/MetJ family transcriptional regulator